MKRQQPKLGKVKRAATRASRWFSPLRGGMNRIAVVGNRLVGSGASTLHMHGFEAATGSAKWTSAAAGTSFDTDAQAFAYASDGLAIYAIELSTGKQAWALRMDRYLDKPSYSAGWLFCEATKNTVTTAELWVIDVGTQSLVSISSAPARTFSGLSAVRPFALVTGERLGFATEAAYMFDVSDGTGTYSGLLDYYGRLSSPLMTPGDGYFCGTGRLSWVECIQRDGGQRWSFDAKAEVASAPIGCIVKGQAARAFGSWGKSVFAVGDSDGKLLWEHPAGAPVLVSLAFNGTDTLYYVTHEGGKPGTLVAIDAATAAVRWRAKLGSWATSAPVFAGGFVYVSGGDGLYCFDA